MTPSPEEIGKWVARQMEGVYLPALLDELRERMFDLRSSALKYGNTDREKAQAYELERTIEYIENYPLEVADTETETGASPDTETGTAEEQFYND